MDRDVLVEHLERVLVDGWEGKALCGVSADYSRGNYLPDTNIPKCTICYLLKMAQEEPLRVSFLWTDRVEMFV